MVPLESLAQRVFTQTYGAWLTPELLREHLDSALSAPQLARELADPRYAYWVCEVDRSMSGFIKLADTRPPACLRSPRAIEVAKLYVDADRRQRGVGSALMAAALASPRATNAESVWLLVWEENTRALAFYERWGFEAVGHQDVHVGDTAFHDLVMELTLGARLDR